MNSDDYLYNSTHNIQKLQRGISQLTLCVTHHSQRCHKTYCDLMRDASRTSGDFSKNKLSETSIDIERLDTNHHTASRVQNQIAWWASAFKYRMYMTLKMLGRVSASVHSIWAMAMANETETTQNRFGVMQPFSPRLAKTMYTFRSASSIH